jgi:hypothetical protein
MGVQPVGRSAWGVWRAEHRSINGLPWVYAVDDAGRIVAWVEYGGTTGKTVEQAEAEAARMLVTARPYPFPARQPLRLEQ